MHYMDTKVCKGCEETLPKALFAKRRKKSTNGKYYTFTRLYCKPCWSEQTALWKKRNPDKHMLQRRRRRGIKTPIGISLTEAQWQQTLDLFDNSCAYCGKPWAHRDHLVPVAMGGQFTKLNIVPACQKCNLEKRAKNPLRFDGAPQAFLKLLEVHL